MTITITVEELKAYEAGCNSWQLKRASLIADYFMKHAVSMYSPFDRNGGAEEFQRAVEIWDRETPFPKLIPTI